MFVGDQLLRQDKRLHFIGVTQLIRVQNIRSAVQVLLDAENEEVND